MIGAFTPATPMLERPRRVLPAGGPRGPETTFLFPCVFVGSAAVVLVMAADPELEPIVLVAAFRRPVKDRVVAHEELEPTPPGLIGLVDDPVLQDESAEARALRQVPSDVCATRAGVDVNDRWQGPEV